MVSRCGQSFFLVVVVSLLRDQSLFMVSRLDRRGQSQWSVIFPWSVSVLLGRRGLSFFRGQSVVLIVVVSRRCQSFFVDGVYILWWLCTRIY